VGIKKIYEYIMDTRTDMGTGKWHIFMQQVRYMGATTHILPAR